MKNFKNVLFATIFLFCGFASAQGNDLKTVPYVDVSKYLGAWYRIASNPLFFEGKCACSRQVLGLRSDNNVSVYNSCNEFPGGPLREIRGFAINQDPTSNARFTVDFGFPHKGQYWIIGLDTNYRWDVVSDPSKTSLYILSKTPELTSEDFANALAEAEKQVDTTKLALEEQKGCTYP